MSKPIPFSIPFVPALAPEYIDKALDLDIQQGGGSVTKIVQKKIQDKYPGYRAFLTPSCTSSIELSLMSIDFGPGDEVILPSFNFTSAVTAITRLFATPVFVDIELDSGNISLNEAEKAITPRTKAIIWVNYAGNESNNLCLKRLARKHNVHLIEDAAHNFGISTESQRNATSDFATFSFHASKNVQCGEGGALLVKDLGISDRARVMIEKGTNRHSFELGQVSKYSWVDKGGSFLLAEVNSAILLAQLENFIHIQRIRRQIIDTYKGSLSYHIRHGWSILEGTEKAAHMFGLMAPNQLERFNLLNFLNEQGIKAVSHYEDLATSAAGLKYGRIIQKCEVSKEFSLRIVRIPLFVEMKEWQITQALEKICHFMRSKI